jgi:hypothetical protein
MIFAIVTVPYLAALYKADRSLLQEWTECSISLLVIQDRRATLVEL